MDICCFPVVLENSYTTINTNETKRICHTPISRSLAHSKVHLSIRIFTKLSDSITNILTHILYSLMQTICKHKVTYCTLTAHTFVLNSAYILSLFFFFSDGDQWVKVWISLWSPYATWPLTEGKPLSFLIIWFHETELVIIGQQGKKSDDKINAEARLVP